MKTVIIPIFDGMIARNLLETDVRRVLVERGIKLVLLPPEGKGDLYEKKWADGKNIFVDKTPVWKNSRFDSILINLFLQSIPTNCQRIRQHDWYYRFGRYGYYYAVSVLRFLGRFRIYQHFLRLVGFAQPIHKSVFDVFERWNPDAVFAPTMIPKIEVMLMRLAKRKGKKVIGMVKSWDNLTSKTFLRVFPDVIIVHNEVQIDEATRLYGYPKERIVVTGIPQFDVYHDIKNLETRESFFDRFGLDPKKKTILYVPAGDWMNPNDGETLKGILDSVDANRFGSVQVLVRLPPAYESSVSSSIGRKNVAFDRPGKKFGERLKSLEFDDDDMRHLAATLVYCDVHINTASTMAIEGALFDKPVILVGYDGKTQLPYWRSVIRYYDREHVGPLVKTGGCRLVTSPDQMMKTLEMFLKDGSIDTKERTKLVEVLCHKTDGKSGERVGNFIADFLEG